MSEVLEEIKIGYKESPLGLIPYSWKIDQLGNVSFKLTDGSHFSPEPKENTGYHIATVKNMNHKSFDLKSCVSISAEDFTDLVRNGCQPVKNDVLFSKDGTIGKTFVFDGSLKIVLLSSIAIIRLIETIEPHYICQILKSNLFYSQLEGLKSGSAIRRVVLKAIKEIKIPIPPIKEQQKIAEILSTVDDKIEVIEQRIKQTQELKKGLMQRLLTKGIGHTKFKDSPLGEIPESWEVVRLGEHVEITSGASPSKFNLLENSRFMFYKVNQLNDFSKYMGDSPYKFDSNVIGSNIKPNSIIFPKRGASIFTNKVRINIKECFVDTNLMTLSTIGSLDHEFLYYFILHFELGRIADTSSIPQINNVHIRPLRIPLPNKEEQVLIADVLKSIDNKIEMLQEKKSTYQELKKGLMQQLLTGKKRVKI